MKKTEIRNYAEASDFLAFKDVRRWSANTLLRYVDKGAIAVTLHNTDVVTYRPDGKIILDSGQWQTVTTKRRINQFLPLGFHLSQLDFCWYVHCENGETIRFYDGMDISPYFADLILNYG